ncbi:4-hydroxyphenylacetate 3-hydroxylase N-terminal domain-containing protein [Bradyrhizobium sp. ARR65]|uniref:4-hydroxyphenylacetate 3-hydroxylase family protein n=1 Tax=Bradyrhizobium sp. ARR65 TaxID=1040989 RepID=UPI000467B7B7|nr:4-hydroxyphenylacetate 3-hydroxylase N-terminal domain-containing protein [Bradyrhizobium sp. ARR65]
MAKDGKAYLSSLRDNRTIYIDGRKITDVTTDSNFRGAVASAARLYDYQAAPENLEQMTFASPTNGKRVNLAWQLPKTFGDLVRRRQAIEKWSALSCGMIGRSPDHVASTLVGLRMGLAAFRDYDSARAAALESYFQYARDNDLFLSYVIINPQSDKAKSASGQPDPHLVASVVDEDSEGITIRGAKMLATSGIMANELLVSGFQALQAGDEAYAFTAVVPLGTKGLSLMSRRSYEQSATSTFDYPLSSRFDENDAVVYFDDVKISWDRVFVFKDLKMAQAQWHDTRAHVFQNYQCIVRLMVKLRFLLGLARKIAETNNIINYPQVRETLGLLAAKVSNIEALVIAMELKGESFYEFYVPDRSMLCSAQVIAQTTYPEVVEAIRSLSGGGMIMVPSSYADFAAPETNVLISKTQRSPVATSEQRVKLMKLAWDAVGSEFGSRHLQYEMFYSGAPFVTRGNSFRFFDWDGVKRPVDQFMGSYGLPDGHMNLPDAAE